MDNPFASIIGSPSGSKASHLTDDSNLEANSPSDTGDGAIILRHPAAPEPSPTAQYLDASIELQSLRIPLVRFPGTKMVVPDREFVCDGLAAFIEEIAPDPAPVIERKDRVPYYIAGTLKEAELINQKLRDQRTKYGNSTVGKQRSSAHIESLGPALFLDDDGDVISREPLIRALGAAAVVYTSHSFGHLKDGGIEPARSGRVALFLNRSVSPSEYGPLWDGINHLLGSGFDEHGRSSALCYGRHARRSEQAAYNRLNIDGAALNADALIELGHSLRPEPKAPTSAGSKANRCNSDLREAIERARLMGAVRPPDDYGEWMSGAAAFKREFAEDHTSAFQCYDAWSACSQKYQGTEPTRGKFDQVPVDYEGAAAHRGAGVLELLLERKAVSANRGGLRDSAADLGGGSAALQAAARASRFSRSHAAYVGRQESCNGHGGPC